MLILLFIAYLSLFSRSSLGDESVGKEQLLCLYLPIALFTTTYAMKKTLFPQLLYTPINAILCHSKGLGKFSIGDTRIILYDA